MEYASRISQLRASGRYKWGRTEERKKVGEEEEWEEQYAKQEDVQGGREADEK